MHHILIAGSGHIGSALAYLLADAEDYQVTVIDLMPEPPAHIGSNSNIIYSQLDITDIPLATRFIQQQQITALVVCLPFYYNVTVAQLAKDLNLVYFDLTEDVDTNAQIANLAADAKTAFVSQCGIAPGFINIIAEYLIQKFESVETVKLRCGALPQNSSNALHYDLTWSIDGLINEYCNFCPILRNGELTTVTPLSELETLHIDSNQYEAFHTSGGLGSLIHSYQKKIKNMDYKTIRYPGHATLIYFLLQELKLADDRPTLKKILLNALPITHNDVVVVYASVHGYQNKRLIKKSYANKFYPQYLHDRQFSAIQMTTATAACIIIDLTLSNPQQYQGFVLQHQFSLTQVLNNRFAGYLVHQSLPGEPLLCSN